MKKQFVALARVSSEEQAKEGFSLDVQVDALRKFAEKQGGAISKLYRIAETASKREERATFKELLGYVKANASNLAGLLFYKVDRAARNLFDYVEIERLELEYGVPVHYVTQPTENTPAGRMQRRILSNMASFYTEQSALDIRAGMQRRLETGWFSGLAPLGYKNIRKEGRAIIIPHPENAAKIKRIFELNAYQGYTLEQLSRQLWQEAVHFRPSQPKFHTSTLHRLLVNRSYIGEVPSKGGWIPGKHEPLIDFATFNRAQERLCKKTITHNQLTYSGQLIRCGHCGHFVTGEAVVKKLKSGGANTHVYYRCTHNRQPGHPPSRVKESVLDTQLLGLFEQMRVQDVKVQKWIVSVLRAKAQARQRDRSERQATLQTELKRIQAQMDRLLALRLAEEIDAETFAAKNAELRSQRDRVQANLQGCDASHDQNTALAIKAFELSQTLTENGLQRTTRLSVKSSKLCV